MAINALMTASRGGTSGGFGKFFEARNKALEGTWKYAGNTPFYSNANGVEGVKGYQARKASLTGTDGSIQANAVGPYRSGDFMYGRMDGGRYYGLNTKDQTFGTEKTKADVYDASGKYLGSDYIDTKANSLSRFIDKAVPLATAGMIAGGLAGAAGVGPFAGGGAAPGATGTAGFAGDPTAWGYGVAEGAGGGATVGGAAAAGAGATATMGSGPLAGLGSILKGGGGMSFDWGDVIGLGKDLIGGYMNSRAADKATDAQVAATERAIALSEPWRKAGATSLNKLQDVLGFNGAGKAQSSLMLDPSYQFRVNEGAKQLERRAASRGRLLSGGTDKALVRYGQDMATQEYTNSVNRLLALAGLGQTSAATNANYATQGGSAQAAGIVAGTNAWTGGLNSAYENWQQNEMLRAMMRRTPSSNTGKSSPWGADWETYAG
jgi:hypothetical protein